LESMGCHWHWIQYLALIKYTILYQGGEVRFTIDVKLAFIQYRVTDWVNQDTSEKLSA